MSFDLGHVRVRDCMHAGILSCSGDAPLGEVAGIMSKYRVHAVALTHDGSRRVAGIVSDVDVVAAAATGREPSAAEVAATEPLTISEEAPMEQAVQLMLEHGVSHLVVINSAGGYPVGILSTMDVAALYAGATVEA